MLGNVWSKGRGVIDQEESKRVRDLPTHSQKIVDPTGLIMHSDRSGNTIQSDRSGHVLRSVGQRPKSTSRVKM